MDKRIQIAVIVLIAVAAAAAFLTRDTSSHNSASAPEVVDDPVAVAPEPNSEDAAAAAPEATEAGDESEPAAGASLPRFVEVGADSCVPCKMMQPILDELRRDYAGKLEIEFADVWKDPALGDKYQVRSIPTQVIYDADGREVFRHTGFWPKEDIDAKLKELEIID